MKLVLIINMFAAIAALNPNRCAVLHYSSMRATKQCKLTNCHVSQVVRRNNERKAINTINTHVLQCIRGFISPSSEKCKKLLRVKKRCYQQ